MRKPSVPTGSRKSVENWYLRQIVNKGKSIYGTLDPDNTQSSLWAFDKPNVKWSLVVAWESPENSSDLITTLLPVR